MTLFGYPTADTIITNTTTVPVLK